MSNSSLVSYTQISPNRNSPRAYGIHRITIHCVVGQCTVEALGDLFANPSRQASSNYGIGYDGRIGMYVEECDRPWTSSSYENDSQAITLELASDSYSPYRVNDIVYEKCIELCTDICYRNGKDKLLWLGSREAALSYSPKENEMVMTAHRWFADTICPGDYLYTRFADIAKKVNERLEDMKWIKCWRLLDDDGNMLKGWQKVNGEWYYLNPTDGIMVTGWLWDKSYKGWFLLGSNGAMLTGWQQVKGKWYYLYPTTTNSTVKGMMATGWLKDKGKWYYLDPTNGYMYANGTYTIDGKQYTFDKSGALVS